jgi:hypothetical protein
MQKEKSIDCGFHADYVIYGADNARLEENEIVNFYYLNIRFKHTEETASIEPGTAKSRRRILHSAGIYKK